MTPNTSKRHYIYSILMIIVLIIMVSTLLPRSPSTTTYTATLANIVPSTPAPTIATTPSILLGNTPVSLELAVTTAEIKQGLSGRLSLAENSGMLFIFSKPDIYQFWMPDMHFPLDMVWINGNKIVDISHDVTNIFDPKNPKLYRPIRPAQYVLEINAGFSKKHNIKIGDTVTFSNIPQIKKQ